MKFNHVYEQSKRLGPSTVSWKEIPSACLQKTNLIERRPRGVLTSWRTKALCALSRVHAWSPFPCAHSENNSRFETEFSGGSSFEVCSLFCRFQYLVCKRSGGDDRIANISADWRVTCVAGYEYTHPQPVCHGTGLVGVCTRSKSAVTFFFK